MTRTVLKKNPDWAERLADYFDEVRYKPFAYGTMDCCIFVADGLRVMTGVDLMADFRGRYACEEDITRLVQSHKAKHVIALIRQKLQEAGLCKKESAFAARGDVALLDVGALGLVTMDARQVCVLHPEQGTHCVPLARAREIWG